MTSVANTNEVDVPATGMTCVVADGRRIHMYKIGLILMMANSAPAAAKIIAVEILTGQFAPQRALLCARSVVSTGIWMTCIGIQGAGCLGRAEDTTS